VNLPPMSHRCGHFLADPIPLRLRLRAVPPHRIFPPSMRGRFSAMARPFTVLLFVALAFRGPDGHAAEGPDFTAEVKPILARSCFRCNGPDEQESGLRLDTATGVREGGYSGATVVPGKSAESLLIHAVTGTGDASAMPPE